MGFRLWPQPLVDGFPASAVSGLLDIVPTFGVEDAHEQRINLVSIFYAVSSAVRCRSWESIQRKNLLCWRKNLGASRLARG